MTLTAAVLAMSGCGGDGLSVSMCDTDPAGWVRPAVIHFDNRDTTALHDLDFAVRHRGAGPFEATVTFAAPDSAIFSEKAVIPLAVHASAGTAAAAEQIPYRRAVRFRQQGRYTITITPSGTPRHIEAAGLVFKTETERWEKTN